MVPPHLATVSKCTNAQLMLPATSRRLLVQAIGTTSPRDASLTEMQLQSQHSLSDILLCPPNHLFSLNISFLEFVEPVCCRGVCNKNSTHSSTHPSLYSEFSQYKKAIYTVIFFSHKYTKLQPQMYSYVFKKCTVTSSSSKHNNRSHSSIIYKSHNVLVMARMLCSILHYIIHTWST